MAWTSLARKVLTRRVSEAGLLNDGGLNVGEKSRRVLVLGNLEAFSAGILKAGSYGVYIFAIHDDKAVMEVVVLDNP
jgi:hypothetical protein